jgi:TolA-binding protein
MAARAPIIAALALLPLMGAPARAQMDSREGIALQNQILELRRDLDALRRGGGGAPVPAPRGGGAAPPETVQGLLSRVQELEETVRRQRGQLDVAENANRRLAEEVEKLRGDMDFRLQQLEGGGRGGATRPPQGPPPAPAPAPQPPQAGPAPQAAPGSPPAPPGPRTAERALADGQAALARNDFATAEAAAREVIAGRPGPRAQDAQLLLGEALLGRRQFQNAALAFDEAYRRNRQSSRAPEALLGLSNAFIGFGARREACDTLEQLASEFTRLPQPVSARVADARRRAQCR